jgi:hypothetical protein
MNVVVPVYRKKRKKNINKGNAKHGVSPRLKFDPVTLTFDLENQ